MVKHTDPLPYVTAILSVIRPLLDPVEAVKKSPVRVQAIMDGVHEYLVRALLFFIIIIIFDATFSY